MHNMDFAMYAYRVRRAEMMADLKFQSSITVKNKKTKKNCYTDDNMKPTI